MQTFLFIRHGTIPIKATAAHRLPPLAKRGLSPRGIEEARAAGGFVRLTLGAAQVDRLLLARSRRAAQTAELALALRPPTLTCGMHTADPLLQLRPWFADLGDDAVVVRVGHGPAFLALLNALHPDPPDYSLRFGAVLVATRMPGRPWSLAQLWAPEMP